MILEEIHVTQRINALRLRAAERYNISPKKCHVGHLILEGLLGYSRHLNQIDAATDKNETNGSVAIRSMRLASALRNHGLRPGDAVVVMGLNHLDMAIPYYACHFNGLSLCGMDPSTGPDDLRYLVPSILPKVVFCSKHEAQYVEDAFTVNNLKGKIIVFDDVRYSIERFIGENNGTEVNFRPAEFNQSEIAAWLILTSGTTGLPKVAVAPFDTILSAMCCWWEKSAPPKLVLALSTFQWLSALMCFLSGPLCQFTRLQCSVPMTPQILIATINKYRPEGTVFTPFILGQFLVATEKICDLTCFKHIIISGGPLEKPLLDRLKSRTNASLRVRLVYSMTELLVPVFDYTEETPMGSVGKPYERYKYKIVDKQDHELAKPFKTGELWIKGDHFFKGYLKNPEETKKMLTDDGWLKTGDIFHKDDENNYYFVERKRLLIRCGGYWISPLQLEGIIQRHPAVSSACVVGIPDATLTEVPVAAIVNKVGHEIDSKEIFNLVKESMPDQKSLHGGFFHLDKLPITASGKIHRAKVKEIALTAERILPNSYS